MIYAATICNAERTVEADTFQEAAQAMAEQVFLPGYDTVRLQVEGDTPPGCPPGRRFTAWCRGGTEGAKGSGGLDGPGIDGAGNRGAAREILTSTFNVVTPLSPRTWG